MKAKTVMVFLSVILLSVLLMADYGCREKRAKRYTIDQFLNTVSIRGGSFSHQEDKLLFTSDESGVYNAYSLDIESGEHNMLTRSNENAIFALSYFPNDDRFLYLSDRGGNEIYHIYLREMDGSVKDLTPVDSARSVFYDWAYDQENFYYGSNRRNPKFIDIYQMDIDNFQSRIVYLNMEGYNFGCVSNDERYISLYRTITTSNSDMYIYDTESKEVKHISPHQGDVQYIPVGFSVGSGSLYYLTDKGREFMYLKRYNIDDASRETIVIADWDITGAYLSHSGRYRVTAINRDARTDIRVYDAEKEEYLKLPRMPEAVITSVEISRSEKYMRFHVNGSRAPNNLFIYDFTTRRYRKLTDSMNPGIDHDDLVDAKVVRYKSFDGLKIPAVYYKPKGVGPGDEIPALVWVHGGPGGQSRVGYSSLIQYLVNHGYAVLAVNNRGSTGYGKTFFKLDDLRHGEDDLRDCVEAKKFLISTGYVDKERIGIIGGSYGGYMVLAALAFQPKEFCVGVDMFGISNWVRTLENIPSWWEAIREALYSEMGDPQEERDYLKRISPLFHAEKIIRPLMVLQGSNDPRVLKEESDDIVEAVRNNGVPVEYIVFKDEGHGFRKKENRREGYGAILEFLDKHLKSRNPESSDLQSGKLHSRKLESGNMHSRKLQSGNLQSRNLKSRAPKSVNLQSGNLESGNLASGNVESRDLKSENLQSRNLESGNV
jgi:dipeptidyl aminopeptidase/acylaminoacyl peptidase